MKKKPAQPKVAAAIKYDSAHDSAPRVTAKGRGAVAEKIIQLARKHNVPIKEDPVLVQILSKLEINEHIPPELYKAVAEILVFMYSLNDRYRDATSGR